MNGRVELIQGFQFIGFPSEWGVQQGLHFRWQEMGCFQFIGFPSEWGVVNNLRRQHRDLVSNLLGSPASGEMTSIC